MIYSDFNTSKKCDYYESVELEITEKLNLNTIKDVLFEMMENQEALRTVFRITKAKMPIQVLLSDFIVALYVNQTSIQSHGILHMI